jgi:hypothetical protein
MISKSDLIMAAMAAPSGPISGPAEYTPFGGAVTKIFLRAIQKYAAA